MLPQQYCLRWKYHHSNLQTMFSQLLDRGCFCDVTLACEGQTIKAHRVVLCACSTYFDAILTNCCSEKDPIIIMKDAKFSDIKCLIEFMYKGEINVEHGSLASLLKTAEELKIKGLAEVSWRDDENHSADIIDEKSSITSQNSNNNNCNNVNNNSSIISSGNTVNSSLAQTNNETDNESVISNAGNNSERKHIPLLAPLTAAQQAKELQYPMLPLKKKRGRPPLDAEFESFVNKQKMANLAKSAAFADSAHLVSVLMDEVAKENQSISKVDSDNNVSWAEQNLDTHMDYDDDEPTPNIIPKLERSETPMDGIPHPDDLSSPNSPSDPGASSSQPLLLTQQELEEWKDVIKMNDYLVKGRRPQFWEEPFCKRVMDSIKNKDLEMKKAAQILGVSYGTLYGRYRETYGCLKHPYRGPFMVSRFRDWTDQTPNEIIQLLQKGVITLPRAAELMNISPTTVSGLLDQNPDWLSINDNENDKEILDIDEDHPDDDEDNKPINFKDYQPTSTKDKQNSTKDKSKEKSSINDKTQQQQINEKENKISLPNHPEINIINVKTKSSHNSKNNNNEHNKNNENKKT